jgi:hypothetical protein
LLFFATFTCPNSNRCSLAQALTMQRRLLLFRS